MDHLILQDNARTSCQTETTPAPIIVVVATALDSVGKSLSSRFDAFVNDELIVRSSKTPFLEAARELLRRGFAPSTYIVMRHKGSATDSLRARIGAAARLTVAEGDRVGIHFQLWKPFPSPAVESPMAWAGRAAAPLQLGPDDASMAPPERARRG
jgi:hypothetical protein